MIWEVLRNDEFAPLKNGNDAKTDNPKTCREAVMRQHAKWLQENGCTFISKQGERTEENKRSVDAPLRQVEISPLVSYSGEVRYS